MSAEITLDDSSNQQESTIPMVVRIRGLLRRVMLAMLLTAFVVAGWYIRHNAPYTTDSDLAYYLGLVGGTLMLALLIYPLRKRFRILQYIGPLRHWFKFHMIAGVLGPLLVLFHSTFQVRSFNAAIALGSMLLVVASGLVGRLLYRRIHRGLYGRKATLGELQETLEQQLEAMRSSRSLPDDVKLDIEQFARLVSSVPESRWGRIMHFLSLGFRRRAAARHAHKAMRDYARARAGAHDTLADIHGLLENIDTTLRAAQNAAQFATYERLFSYWHAVHIPFLFMLLVTALVHVFAVHAY